MALYHMDIKAHSRSLNIHAIALSSYRSGEKLRCDADGKVRNCRREDKSTVLFKALLNNRGLNRERLWNKAEAAERRKDAVVAREMELGLPCELSLEEQQNLSMMMAQRIAEKYKCAVDLTVHAPDKEGDQRNFHVHLLFTSRSWSDERDQRSREFSSRKYRDLNKANAKEEVLFWRALWEEIVNQAYERKDLEERVSSLSCEEQGKLKKYEYLDFEKYQHLRRVGELEDAKQASRLGLEIEREELELDDLMEIKKLLQKERETLKEDEHLKEREDAGFRRREQNIERAESRNSEKAGSTGGRLEQFDQKSLSNGSNGSSRTSHDRSQRSERYFKRSSGYNDSGDGGMETGTGSREAAKSDQEPAKIGARLLALARLTIKVIFKNKWLGKLKFFRKEKLTEEQEQLQHQSALDQKIEQGVKRSTFNLAMTAKEAERNRLNREYEEKIEVERTINRLRRDLRDKFINFQGLDLKKDYKTVLVAREEIRNIFGSLKSSQDIIIGFHTYFNVYNKRESAAQCGIEEVRNPKAKSNWTVYELEVEEGQRLEDLLNEKCHGFYLDPNLILRENQTRREMQESIERQIENLEKNGIKKFKLSISQVVLDQEKKQRRGFKL